MEKETATHPAITAWRIPGAGSLVGCRLWGPTKSVTERLRGGSSSCSVLSRASPAEFPQWTSWAPVLGACPGSGGPLGCAQRAQGARGGASLRQPRRWVSWTSGPGAREPRKCALSGPARPAVSETLELRLGGRRGLFFLMT